MSLPLQVVARRGPQPVYKPSSGVETHITMVGCTSATGEVLCPTLVFQGERCRADWSKQWPEARATANSSGYMTTGLFIEWAEWFVEASGATRDGKRRVLFVDNHKSHLSVEARQIFKDHNVQVVSMHPHTTHVFCVLDVAIFATFKRKLYSIFRKKCIPGVAVTREILVGWMRTAYRKATKDRVDPKTGETFNPSVRGFAKTGLYPFKPKVASDVIFAHHREWVRQKEAALVEAEGVAVVDQPAIYALSHDEREGMIESLKKDGALQIKLAQEVAEDPRKVKRARKKDMSQLLTSDARMELDRAKEEEKAAEEERLEAGRKKRAEEKAARGGLTKADWDKQQAAQKKAQKEADKAAQAAAAAAEKAAREAELAAVEPKAKKARVAAKAPAAKAPPKAANGNLYAKHYAAAGLQGGKRRRD